jgi:ankyrin repeat protein
MHHEDSGDAAVAEGVVWHRATCPERGRDYFYTRAGETRWDPPGELLYGAAFEGDAGAVASLLGLGAAADYSLPEGGATSLYVACESGRPEVARHLVEARADPNLKRHDGATPLLAACSGPEATRHELASLLARGGARPDPAALRYAVHSGSLELVQLLLDHGASPNPNPNPNPNP